jgi:hypothetical protein
MTKIMLLMFMMIICLFSLSFSADPFYTNLLNEGKQLYMAGKLDEALEDFKIAEFGLIDEKEFIPELYFYYALAQYKKGALGESKALMDKMKLVLGETEIDKIVRPKEIEHDLSIMTRALDYLARPGARAVNLQFFNLFYETLDQLRAQKLEAAEAGIKRLERLNGDDARLAFLKGFLYFQKEDYKKCVKTLGGLIGKLDGEFGEESSFYLAYSYLKRGDLAAGEKCAARIQNPDYVHRLMLLMEEVKAQDREKGKKK